MGILYPSEHISCFNYDKTDQPLIEVLKIVKGKTEELHITASEIVFFLEGRIRFTFKDKSGYEGVKGQFFFLPSGSIYSCQALVNSMVIIFRITKPLRLCNSFPIEKLYNSDKPVEDCQLSTKCHLGILEINTSLWHFLYGINDCLGDGIRCRYYFELKIKELLFYLRMYYTKEELCDFFILILSGNTIFSEYVRLNWQRFHSITEMAGSMNLTHRQFLNRFITVFGARPQQWLNEEKAHVIHREITTTAKQFKQIAAENGFAHEAILTRFCKRKLGATPTEIREGKVQKVTKKP